MIDNLMTLVENSEIASTGAKPKLPTTIPNLTDKMLEVYRIPLKYLYYNDENGRIATQIRRSSEDIQACSDAVSAKYNDQVAKFIEEDNLAALNKTKKSIQSKGQQVYGYVLKDGRIIDGNRRFTALRQLTKETGRTFYFEAVILPFTYDAKADRAQIKRLELAIQMGTEEKLQYDPVDLSIDVYQTVVKDELMTEKDYALEANMTTKAVENLIATVELIHDFLKFINSSVTNYHIIKDVKLYTPLFELAKKFKTVFPDKGPKYEQTKESSFTLLSKMVLAGGDTGRNMRDYLKEVVNSQVNDTYNHDIEEVVDDFRDKLDQKPIETAADYRKRLAEATPEMREVSEVYNSTISRQNRGKNVDNFISEVKETMVTLQDMQRGGGLSGNLHFSNFSKKQIAEIREMLVNINIISGDLIEEYENEL
ncbi:hypothetical protein LVU50_09615 [Latilactobacillus sakei subsp. carnosus]|uniref:hypothetical protein n=1 Tax=Latilactobacillus sakei TaxID=1599 RepID=UPI000C1294B1|nr:hypothetical protein [Latilactobacillus sakei]MCM1572080.1 hypothetical protein [Latilactobacillus sakei]SON65476.1 conserved protein of unknown function [Latilactobacillus sakei]